MNNLSKEQSGLLETALYAGEYHLLLGAGFSKSSISQNGTPVLDGDSLTKYLQQQLGIAESSSLNQLYIECQHRQLVKPLITNNYCGCTPDPKLGSLCQYVWKRAYTFNIDDVLENLYDSAAHPKQSVRPINWTDDVVEAENRAELFVVHLHGFAPRGEEGYVFSIKEYVQVSREVNPWMAMLSNQIAVRPFIIIGTQLSEYDLEYYLNSRHDVIRRSNPAPSLYVTPRNDAIVKTLCERFDLVHVPMTATEFGEWLQATFPNPRSARQILGGDSGIEALNAVRNGATAIRFLNDFNPIQVFEPKEETRHSPFLLGAPASWDDIRARLDITRAEEDSSKGKIREFLRGETGTKLFVVEGEAASGKRTMGMRICFDLAQEGFLLFEQRLARRFAVESLLEVASALDRPIVIWCDRPSDNIDRIAEFFDRWGGKAIAFVGQERFYRTLHLKNASQPELLTEFEPDHLLPESYSPLLSRLRQVGLLGKSAGRANEEIIPFIRRRPVLEVLCEIREDFVPLRDVAQSLWTDLRIEQQRAYLIVSLARSCCSIGLREEILLKIMNYDSRYSDLFDNRASSLTLEMNPHADEMCIPTNSLYADFVLELVSDDNELMMLDAFVSIADAIASYVSPHAIKVGSPEALLMRWLFNVQTYVGKYLSDDASKKFFAQVEDSHGWNSRYWEQRAKLYQKDDPELALEYARHGWGIEAGHPLAQTTLAHMIFNLADTRKINYDEFKEAADLLLSAIETEAQRKLQNLQPYVILLSGTKKYIAKGGGILRGFSERIEREMQYAKRRLRLKPELAAVIDEILDVIK